MDVQLFYSNASVTDKVAALRKACERHGKLTKECSQGLGQDRHLYALYCLQRRLNDGSITPPESSDEGAPGTSPASETSEIARQARKFTPSIFLDSGWEVLNTSILSTSNCGNPALRLFGFAPVTPEGYGIGYIIKDDRLSV